MQDFWQKYTVAGFIHDKFMLNIIKHIEIRRFL